MFGRFVSLFLFCLFFVFMIWGKKVKVSPLKIGETSTRMGKNKKNTFFSYRRFVAIEGVTSYHDTIFIRDHLMTTCRSLLKYKVVA